MIIFRKKSQMAHIINMKFKKNIPIFVIIGITLFYNIEIIQFERKNSTLVCNKNSIVAGRVENLITYVLPHDGAFHLR